MARALIVFLAACAATISVISAAMPCSSYVLDSAARELNRCCTKMDTPIPSDVVDKCTAEVMASITSLRSCSLEGGAGVLENCLTVAGVTNMSRPLVCTDASLAVIEMVTHCC